jgi:hypothetical protein
MAHENSQAAEGNPERDNDGRDQQDAPPATRTMVQLLAGLRVE